MLYLFWGPAQMIVSGVYLLIQQMLHTAVLNVFHYLITM